jgi:hypothetical protein
VEALRHPYGGRAREDTAYDRHTRPVALERKSSHCDGCRMYGRAFTVTVIE